MTRECQKEATKRHRAKIAAEGGLKFVRLEFRKADMDLYDHIRSQADGMSGYIKKLIRNDMGL